MKINIAGWESEGFRSPDIKLNFQKPDGSIPKVTLIQMPNGTGKTTTLELIKAALSGSASDWTPDDVSRFKRHDSEALFGIFKINLLIDQKPLTIELKLNYEHNTVSYKTTSPDKGGVISRWALPPEIHKFFTKEFLRLFIFDGKFTADLLKADKSLADGAIDALCQLYLLEQIEDVANREWDNKTKRNVAKTSVGLNKYKAQEKELIHRKRNIEKAKKTAEENMVSSRREIEKLENNISAHMRKNDSTNKQYVESEIELGKTNTELQLSSASLMKSIRLPISIHPTISESLKNLKNNLDYLKLPENTSAQFFQELMLEDTCICGREMTEGAKKSIELGSKEYLDTADSGVINALKLDIDSYLKAEPSQTPNDILQEKLRRLSKARMKKQRAQQAVNILKKRSIEQGDHELKTWQNDLDKQQDIYDESKEALDGFNEKPINMDEADIPSVNNLFSLYLIEKKLTYTQRKIAEIGDTVSLFDKTKKLKEILNDTANQSREIIRKELISITNDRLAKVLVNDQINITKVDQFLHLEGQDGASAGQTLSIGYTFLMSVLNRGNNDFPIVVDNPAGDLERIVRTQIAKLILELCNQFIGFTINTDNPGFVPGLEKSADDCQFFTLFRKTPGTKRLMSNLPREGVIQTANAVLVNDKNYFNNFDLTDETDQ